MNNNNSYNPYTYSNINHNPITYTQVYYNHTINPEQTKNVMYGGNTILRNGSNSYRPLPITAIRT
jgi:hypothetical protein